MNIKKQEKVYRRKSKRRNQEGSGGKMIEKKGKEDKAKRILRVITRKSVVK